jgi:hypothetical protein
VDGYNGAFIVTHDSALDQKLEADAAAFKNPDSRRICKIIRTTFIWNFCLRRLPFNCFVFPLLWVVKMTNPQKFEQILGPKIALEMPKEIPKYYFEDITSIQCRTIARHLINLDNLLSKRLEEANRAANAYEEVMGMPIGFSSNFTYWQFIVPTNDLAKARNALFKIGVETGATNLMNLAEVSGIELSGAKSLKGNHIFIPIHEWVSFQKYREVFRIIYADKLAK